MFLHALVILDRIIKSQRIAFSWTVILWLAVVCACAGIVSAGRQSAQSQDPQAEKPRAIGMLQIDLVNVFVSVYGRDGKIVDGLQHDAFRVYEDKAEQRIGIFTHEDTPASIGLLIEHSGTIKSLVDYENTAASRFLHSGNPHDEFFVADFNDHLVVAKTAEELMALLTNQSPHGGTALLDALYLGLDKLKGTRNAKKALLIISNGSDNLSRHSRDDLRKLVKDAGVLIYSLIWNPAPVVGSNEEVNGSDFLIEISKLSGGRAITVRDPNYFAPFAEDFAVEIRKLYQLGYYSTNGPHGPNDRRWRKLEVKVNAKGTRGPLTIYAPPGYTNSTAVD
jgi:Ca-activated chloride channel homolog